MNEPKKKTYNITITKTYEVDVDEDFELTYEYLADNAPFGENLEDCKELEIINSEWQAHIERGDE